MGLIDKYKSLFFPFLRPLFFVFPFSKRSVTSSYTAWPRRQSADVSNAHKMKFTSAASRLILSWRGSIWWGQPWAHWYRRLYTGSHQATAPQFGVLSRSHTHTHTHTHTHPLLLPILFLSTAVTASVSLLVFCLVFRVLHPVPWSVLSLRRRRVVKIIIRPILVLPFTSTIHFYRCLCALVSPSSTCPSLATLSAVLSSNSKREFQFVIQLILKQ